MTTGLRHRVEALNSRNLSSDVKTKLNKRSDETDDDK